MPCKFPGNFFAIKPDGGLILKEGKFLSFTPVDSYLETFESFTEGEKLSDDGSFVPTLNIPGGADSFTTVAGVGVDGSNGVQATEDSCNTFTCINWDSAETSVVTFATSFKWTHTNSNPAYEGEVFFINFRESLTPSTSITNVSNRLGILLSQRSDGDYELYATDKAAPKSSLGTISKSQIQYSSTDTYWLRATVDITKTTTNNRWDLSVTLDNLGPNGVTTPSNIISNSKTNLYDNNIYDDKLYFQFFVYGFSAPSPINDSFVIDNLSFKPLPGNI